MTAVFERFRLRKGRKSGRDLWGQEVHGVGRRGGEIDVFEVAFEKNRKNHNLGGGGRRGVAGVLGQKSHRGGKT